MRFSRKIEQARQIAQKTETTERGHSWYGEYFVNHFSIYLSYFFWKAGISANAVTITMGTAGLIGSVCMVFDRLWLTITGAILWQLWFVLDCVDGEVARLHHKESLFGVYLDDLTHIVVNPTFGLALGLRVCLKEWSIFNTLATFILYSGCHWKRGIPRIIFRTMVVKSGPTILERWTYRFNKKSVVSWLRFIAVESCGEVGQMLLISGIIIASYAVKYDIARWFLYSYTILFLGYLAGLTLRDGYIVRQEDKRSAAKS